eukprot:TRINITY_DN4646_c0_g2_i1.p1 TRINITY_DN4646_c0_g2~~TRINITY_DN4646_c0_g2_i1.p1  ORF type:complete len:1131 (+),score=174.41 TRINITY_DN4646_c0_g2_i1:318-3395(+)
MDDPRNLPGLAHFCEHMLFLGTAKYPDPLGINKFLEKAGGSSNAYTSSEVTVFHMEFSSSALAEANDRFADFFRAPLFNRTFVQKEVHAINSEFEKNLQDPTRRVLQVISNLADPESAVNHFSTGNYQTLYEAPKNEGRDIVKSLESYFRDRYCPQQMRVVTVGPQSLEEQLSVTALRFGALPPRHDKSCDSRNFSLPVAWPQERLSQWVVVEGSQPRAMLWLYFNLPDLRKHFLSHPMTYLNHVLTYAGERSLLTTLRKDLGLVTEMKCSADSTSAGTSLYVYFVLTREGVEHLQGLLDIFFSYVALLKQQGVSTALYQSLADTLSLQFNWTQPRSPMNTAKDYAERMLRLPPEKLLSGDTRIDKLDTDLVTHLISKLTPDNMVASYVPSSTDGKTPFPNSAHVQTLPYYGLKYAALPLEVALPGGPSRWAGWLAAAKVADSELRHSLLAQGLQLEALPEIPGPIEDIPKDLPTTYMKASVSKAHSADTGTALYGTEPLLLADEGEPLASHRSDRGLAHSVKIWYRSGWRTTSPKMSLQVFFRPYEGAGVTQLDELRLILFGKLLNKELEPKLSDLTVTGQSVNVAVSKDGLAFKITGFEPVLHKLLDRVLFEFNSFHMNQSAVHGSKFAGAVQELHDELSSHTNLPAVYAVSDKKVLLSKGETSDEEALSMLDRLTPTAVMRSVGELLLSQPLSLDSLVMGNIGKEVANSAVNKLLTGISVPSWVSKTNVQSSQARVGDYAPIVKLLQPAEVRSLNPRAGDPNDVAHVAILHGIATVESRVVYGILGNMLKESLYTQLRTQEQLGYIVTGGTGLLSNIHYVAAVVQGSVLSADEMEVAIESVFLKWFPQQLRSLTEREFQDHKQAFLESLLQPPMSTDEELAHFIGSVSHGGVCFDLLNQLIDFANSSRVSKDFLAESWTKLMSPEIGHRKKVSIKYFAKKVPERPAVEKFRRDLEKRKLTDRSIERLSREHERTQVFERADSAARGRLAETPGGGYYPTDIRCERVGKLPSARPNFLQRMKP